MATSITAAGIVFPDSSVQTTAATAGGGTTEAIASGALSDGSTVVVNADGTVSVVVQGGPSAGTAVVFNNSLSYSPSAVYDSANQKVVVVYRNASLNRGEAVVGTVSGTSISFGTPVVYVSARSDYFSAAYDVTNGKIFIAYDNQNNLSRGTGIVGTVSGTSISFGTPVVFETGGVIFVSATYDVASSKVVVAYSDTGNSSYGTSVVGTISGTSVSFGTPVVFKSTDADWISTTYDSGNSKVVISYDNNTSSTGEAVVGTVSGTSISFGSSAVFENSGIAGSWNSSSAYNASNGKVVISYTDDGNSNYGTAVVGTVSGTSISFGTPVVFESANTGYPSSAYYASVGKVVISYSDVGNSLYGTAIVGTISGTSISFGTPVVFESAFCQDMSSTYDSFNQKIIIAYKNLSISNRGEAVVFQNESTNLTTENYIGISDGAYSDATTATIQIAGAVDDAQSGLTAGQAYYVQSDGTLSETPDTPEVFAGTAISATKLVVQG